MCGHERWTVLGGSWGSTLALAYAQEHPRSVDAAVLFAVVTTSAREVEWVTRGVRVHFPEEWERFVGGVPESERGDGLAGAYARLLAGPDIAQVDSAAARWCEWDERISTPPGVSPSGARFAQARFRRCWARIVTHYWSNAGFVPDGALLAGARSLGEIPGFLVHGQSDLSAIADVPQALAAVAGRAAEDGADRPRRRSDDVGGARSAGAGPRGGPVSAAALIFGAPGAGKSTILERLTERLEGVGSSFGAIESEQFGWGNPLLGPEAIAEQLKLVIAWQRSAGRNLFLVAATVETAAELEMLAGALACDPCVTVALDAPAEICARRVSERERDEWVGKRELVRRTGDLAVKSAAIPATLRIDSAQLAPDVAARRIVAALRAAGALAAP